MFIRATAVVMGRGQPHGCAPDAHRDCHGHDRAVKRNQIGLLASILASDPKMARFLRHVMTPDDA